jgi:hypothetical protein
MKLSLSITFIAYSYLTQAPRTVLDRLGQMHDFDLLLAREIGDGAAEFEDAVIGAGAQIAAEDSPPSSPASFSKGTRRTSVWISMRSMSGPY